MVKLGFDPRWSERTKEKESITQRVRKRLLTKEKQKWMPWMGKIGKEARNKPRSCSSLIYFRACLLQKGREKLIVRVPPPLVENQWLFGGRPQWCWDKCHHAGQVLLRYLWKSDQQLPWWSVVLLCVIKLTLEVGIWAMCLSEFFRNLPQPLNIESSDVLKLALVSKDVYIFFPLKIHLSM